MADRRSSFVRRYCLSVEASRCWKAESESRPSKSTSRNEKGTKKIDRSIAINSEMAERQEDINININDDDDINNDDVDSLVNNFINVTRHINFDTGIIIINYNGPFQDRRMVLLRASHEWTLAR